MSWMTRCFLRRSGEGSRPFSFPVHSEAFSVAMGRQSRDCMYDTTHVSACVVSSICVQCMSFDTRLFFNNRPQIHRWWGRRFARSYGISMLSRLAMSVLMSLRTTVRRCRVSVDYLRILPSLLSAALGHSLSFLCGSLNSCPGRDYYFDGPMETMRNDTHC